MGLENNYNAGNKGSNFNWQLKMLQELGANNDTLTQILAVLGGAPTVDYELWVSGYKANKVGTGYSTGDFIQRVTVLNAKLGTISSTLWFNENGGFTIPTPPQSDLDVYNPTNAVTLFPTSASAGAASKVSSSAYESSHVIKAAAGNFYGLVGYNSKTTDQWVQVHDSATLPANGAVPVFSEVARALSNFYIFVGDIPVNFSNGIVVCNSTTGPTKTLGSADCFFTVKYS